MTNLNSITNRGGDFVPNYEPAEPESIVRVIAEGAFPTPVAERDLIATQAFLVANDEIRLDGTRKKTFRNDLEGYWFKRVAELQKFHEDIMDGINFARHIDQVEDEHEINKALWVLDMLKKFMAGQEITDVGPFANYIHLKPGFTDNLLLNICASEGLSEAEVERLTNSVLVEMTLRERQEYRENRFETSDPRSLRTHTRARAVAVAGGRYNLYDVHKIEGAIAA